MGKPVKHKIVFLVFVLSVFTLTYSSGKKNSVVDMEEYSKLLIRLNTDMPGLERVKQMLDRPEAAVAELLTYYRNGNSGKHPIDKNDKVKYLGNCASDTDMEAADNALKHIFIGQSAYPPYFCGDDIDWSTSPVPDKEWVWQLNRMGFWDAMARAYWHTGDEKYAQAWADQLTDWIRKNPNDADHQYSWRSIEAGIRGYKWMELFQYFIDSPAFTTDVLVAFLNSCYDHASYLMTKYSTGSNWALMEAEGMAFIAIIFPQFKDAGMWRTEAFRRLNAEIGIQVYPDGHQRELAMGYHIGCIDWFLRTYELAKMNGQEKEFNPAYLVRIEQMCEVPMKICLPDGSNVQFGDAWTGTPGQYNTKFQKWAELFGRDDFLCLASDGKKGTPPAKTTYDLPQSGIYSMRSGWNKDAICLVLKCGPDGGYHCQPDNGTFDIYAGGRNLMPDAGCYIYSGDPENRAWFRQTKVHKTLTLDNKNSKYAPKLLLWDEKDDLDILVVENDSYDDLTHRRSVFFIDKSYFVIVDEAIGPATGEIDIHFQFAPGEILMNQEKLTAQSAFEDGWNILVRTHPQKGLQMAEEEGRISFRYTQMEPRTAFCYKLNKTADQMVRFVTLIVPFETQRNPDIQIKPLKHFSPGEISLEIEHNGRKRKIGYSL